MLRRKPDLHAGNLSGSPAAINGNKPITHAFNEDSHSVIGFVSRVNRLRHEHTSKAYT